MPFEFQLKKILCFTHTLTMRHPTQLWSTHKSTTNFN